MARLLAISGSGRFWERSLHAAYPERLTQRILSDANPSIGSTTSGLRPPLATLLETRGFSFPLGGKHEP